MKKPSDIEKLISQLEEGEIKRVKNKAEMQKMVRDAEPSKLDVIINKYMKKEKVKVKKVS